MLLRVMGEVVGIEIDLISKPANSAEKAKENDKRYETSKSAHFDMLQSYSICDGKVCSLADKDGVGGAADVATSVCPGML